MSNSITPVSLSRCKVFILQKNNIGSDAGLAILLPGEEESNIEFVPWQLHHEQTEPISPSDSLLLKNIKIECLKQTQNICTNDVSVPVETIQLLPVKTEQDSELFKPFQFGWKRECFLNPVTSGVEEKGIVAEVQYVSPYSAKLKKSVRLKTMESVLSTTAKYFPDMELQDFNFSYESVVLGAGWEQELVKQKDGRRYKIQCPLCFKLIFNSLHHHMNNHKRQQGSGELFTRDIKPSHRQVLCPVCQPDKCLQATSWTVSLSHLAMHKYKPTQSRKELTRCYVPCSRVEEDLYGDRGPRHLCVHCGLKFSYLDGAWKRHVRKCLKLMKQSEKSYLLTKKGLLPKKSPSADLGNLARATEYGKQFFMKENLENHLSKNHCNKPAVVVKDDPDGPSAQARATCEVFASEILKSWNKQNKDCFEKLETIQTAHITQYREEKILFTIRCLENITNSISNKCRVFSFSIGREVQIREGMAAFGRQFGLDYREIEFKCKGKLLLADMKASEAGGSTIWARKL